MTSVDFFIKGHIIHGLLQGLDPLDAGAGFKSVCTSSCFKFKQRLCTKRNFLLFSNILLIGRVRGLYVMMNGMAGLGSVVGMFVECRRSILS